MAAEGDADLDTDLDRIMEEIRRELVLKVAKMDRDEHREIYDALENE